MLFMIFFLTEKQTIIQNVNIDQNNMTGSSKTTVYITTKEHHKIKGKNFLINAMFIVDENNDIYLCQNFPKNYKGKSPFLTLHIYDNALDRWGIEDAEKNYITEILWNCYVKNNRPKMIDGGGKYDCEYLQNIYAKQKTPDDSDYASSWYIYKAFQGGDVMPK